MGNFNARIGYWFTSNRGKLSAMNKLVPSTRAERAVRRAFKLIVAARGQNLPLANLAASVAMSPQHLQRVFKGLAGVSPKELQDELRKMALKSELQAGGRITDAIYNSGYGSSSRVYERARQKLGMSPAQYGRGGRGQVIAYASAPTPIGMVLVAATDQGICSIQIGDNAAALRKNLAAEFPQAEIVAMPRERAADFDKWMDALRLHLSESQPLLDLPLQLRGTAFQLRVWKYLQKIPYGARCSYREVADAIGVPGGARAVAGACAKNRLALAIPCHRVVRGTGDISGYRWGPERKRALLARENTLTQRISMRLQAPERQRKLRPMPSAHI
jgi:AraC family transcriptional regulator, regulatory protein of adaptative response / methylated-DNA-[protein]-cysteine methyltransferase